MNQYMEQTENYVLHTYNRFPLVIESADGVYVKDTEGKEYLDFAAGIAVYGLGYHYPGFDEALKSQIDKVMHTLTCIIMCLWEMLHRSLHRQLRWIKYSLQTVVQKPLKEPSRLQENMHGSRMDRQIMRSLP